MFLLYLAEGITPDTGPAEDAPGNAQQPLWPYINMFLTDSFVGEPEGLTTSYEQNPNLEQYRLNDNDWSLLIDLNAYLDIWQRFNIEVNAESRESNSRLFSALKALERDLRFFQKRKPHMKPISYALRETEEFIHNRLLELSLNYLIGNRFVAMQTIPGANFVNSPQPYDKIQLCVRAL